MMMVGSLTSLGSPSVYTEDSDSDGPHTPVEFNDIGYGADGAKDAEHINYIEEDEVGKCSRTWSTTTLSTTLSDTNDSTPQHASTVFYTDYCQAQPFVIGGAYEASGPVICFGPPITSPAASPCGTPPANQMYIPVLVPTEAFLEGQLTQAPIMTKRTPLRSTAALFEPTVEKNDAPTEDADAVAATANVAAQATLLTTIMLCNIPLHCSRSMVMDMLWSEGFGEHVEFLYLPMNLRRSGNFGYAFVDFDSTEVAQESKNKLQGYVGWNGPNDSTLEVSWSNTQGLDAHVQRYRDSPLMHVSVDDESKPAMFKKGVRVAFPPPTKTLRPPRLRKL